VKRFFVLILLLSGVLVVPMSCGGDPQVVVVSDGGVERTPRVCTLSKCPKPDTGIACCTPNAHCGIDPTGLGLACQPNPDDLSGLECVLDECPTPSIGTKCCSPLASCGWDPFGNGFLCLPNGAPLDLPDGGPLCNLRSCPFPDGSDPPCCQFNGECGVDPGLGFCMPPPLCNVAACPDPAGGYASCCLANGECGVDVFGIGLCFPPPAQFCDLDECPTPEGGANACCLANGQCGVDVFNNGSCFPPPPEPTCDLDQCPLSTDGSRACCLPNGQCGQDSLGIGLCFVPPPAPGDGGAPVTGPPDDPSITGECPSFIGVFGPIWGCCSDFGVCGTFASDACLLPVGTQFPAGPPPPPEAGVSEPFLRCNPPD
jgi:hypothetical protein